MHKSFNIEQIVRLNFRVLQFCELNSHRPIYVYPGADSRLWLERIKARPSLA